MIPTEDAEIFESVVTELIRLVKSDRTAKFEDKLNELCSKGTRASYAYIKEARDEALQRHQDKVARQWSDRDPALLLGGDRSDDDAWFDGELPEGGNWSAFEQALVAGGDLSEDDLESLRALLRRLITQLPNPNGRVRTILGVLFGRVQIGKTTNYSALMAVLADLGYAIVIVLAGTKNSLRGQTQLRIEETVTDLDRVGWSWLTGPEDDADIEPERNPGSLVRGSQRVVAVVKKEKTRLRNLHKFLSEAGPALNGKSVLVIDDECDEASVNTGVRRPTAISKQISDILETLEEHRARTAYIGVSATPYANLLIDPDEAGSLFPRDFVVPLAKSESYFGGEEFFGRDAIDDSNPAVEGLGLTTIIDDRDVPKIRPSSTRTPSFRTWKPSKVDSLIKAVNYFVLASAARRARGQTGHSSMLIHVHHETEVMDRLRPVVDKILSDLVRLVDQGDLAALEELWRTELQKDVLSHPKFADSGLRPVSFDGLRPFLVPVLEATTVAVDHSGPTAERLQYGKAPSAVIVIGGNTMSRGLTLKGLVTSYFVRPTETSDALLQDCRWFGYRPGYGDLQRVWLPKGLLAWFREITLIESEMFITVEQHAKAGRTPREAGLRIRMPDSRPLKITSRAKMGRGGIVSAGYAGTEKASTRFSANETKKNLAALEEMLRNCGIPDSAAPGHLYRDVSGSEISRFLRAYSMPEGPDDDNHLVAKYIDDEIQRERLQTWNVFIHDGPGDPIQLVDGPVSGTVERAARSNGQLLTINAITDPSDRVVDFDADDRCTTENGRKLHAALEIRQNSELPALLIVYLIKPNTGTGLDGDCLVGWTADFPGLRAAERVRYVGNRAIENRD